MPPVVSALFTFVASLLRPIQQLGSGKVVAVPEVGGLHHHYERQAA